MRSCYQFLSFCEVVLRLTAIIYRAIINDKEEYFKWEFSQIDEKVKERYVLACRQGSWEKKEWLAEPKLCQPLPALAVRIQL